MVKLKIIDISSYQRPQDIDYDRFVTNIDGVILRVGFTGYGTGESYYKDAYFERHYQEFLSRGVPIGAYWYSCANEPGEGKAEAVFMYNIIKNKKFSLPIYWDTEDAHHQRPTSTKGLTDAGLEFLSYLESKGYYVGVYASASWLNSELDMSRLGKYDVWVAHYGVSAPSYSKPYGMWQFTDKLSVSGFKSGVDGNWAYIDYPALIRSLGLNGYPKPKVDIVIPKSESKPARTDLLTWDGDLARYFVDGEMKLGWQKLGSYWHFFRPKNGYMVYGGFYNVNGSTYYFRKNTGTMAIGWQFINGDWYYFRTENDQRKGYGPAGSMVRGPVVLDGELVEFSNSGSHIRTGESYSDEPNLGGK